MFNLVRVGGLEAFALDGGVHLRYGIDQCVGDTLCTGGIMSQRGHPGSAGILQGYSGGLGRRLPAAELCQSAMAMITWACNKSGL